jgi:photosystem II stability/assembly factor-like uncharacterized protein
VRSPRHLYCVLVLLTLGAATSAQSSLWPPVLLSAPSDPLAPPASAVLLPGKSMTVNAVAVDAQDNVYLAGTGNAPDVPGLERGLDATPDGNDAFVAKLDRNGKPVWATYVGGTDRRPVGSRAPLPFSDSALAIAVDAAGQVIVAGTTAADNFPVVGALQSSRRGDIDGFVVKLSADGRRILYSSYIGATGESMSAHGIAVGPAGEIWIAALSPQQRWLATNDVSNGTGRVVVLKLNPVGTPVWSTRVGLATAGGFAVDGAGQPYVAGASCTSLGVCHQVLMRLDPSGTRLQFSTAFPNRNADLFTAGLALLPDGRAAFTGVAFDPLPVRNEWQEAPTCEGTFSGCGDAFLAIAGESGELETLSYLGLGESAPLVAADAFGRITVASRSSRTSMPLTRPLLDHHVAGPVYVSHDRATSWQVAGRETLPGTGVADLVFNWLRNGLYLAANALFESRDEAKTWRVDSQGGVSTDIWYRIAVDSRQPSIRYGIFGDHVYRQDDGTPQWRMVSRSAPGTYRRTVVVSPYDSSVWIAGNAGVAMSTTGGDTWVDRSVGLPNLHGSSSTVEDLDFDGQHAGVVYAMTQVGLYRSIDNGATWQDLTSGFSPPPYARAIAFDPVRSDTLHVATLNYGLLKSTDAGRTWVRTLDGRMTVVRTDQMKRHIVYAAGSDSDGRNAFYRSIDRGETWHRAADGLDMPAEPSRLVADPRDSSKLYLASSSYTAVPYVIRLRSDAANRRTFVTEFASYLGHGEVRALASTLSGGIVAALIHRWPAANLDQQQIVTVMIAP